MSLNPSLFKVIIYIPCQVICLLIFMQELDSLHYSRLVDASYHLDRCEETLALTRIRTTKALLKKVEKTKDVANR